MMEKVTQMIAMLIKAWKKESVSQIDTPPVPATPEPKQQSPNNSACLTERVNTFLQTHYDFRYNRLTEETEFRPLSGAKTEFRPIGKRELNTLCMEAHAEGISCWDKDVSRYIYSTQIGEYHPFRLYMDELPPWDGIDRLTPLARRVSALPLPHMDAGTGCPMGRKDGCPCQQPGSHPDQCRTGTDEIDFLQIADAQSTATLLYG